MAKQVVLKSNGRILLLLPKVFGQRQFWFTSISDPESSVEMTEYPDAQTGRMLQKRAYTTTEPVTISTPYDEAVEAGMLPLVKFLEGLKNNPDDTVEFQLSEKIGSLTSRSFAGVTYNTHTLPGTDMSSNDARMFSIVFDYLDIVI